MFSKYTSVDIRRLEKVTIRRHTVELAIQALEKVVKTFQKKEMIVIKRKSFLGERKKS